MATHRLKQLVDDWMVESYHAPWRSYIKLKQDRGELVAVGNVLVDASNIFLKPFTCDSCVCSPGLRPRGKQSCCAELEASVTQGEMDGIRKHFDKVDAVLRRQDPAWARRPRTFEQCLEPQPDFTLQLAKRAGRCVFSYHGPKDQLWCAVHTAGMEEGLDVFRLKPRLCSIFPLLLQELEDDTYLLSLLDEQNGSLIGFTSYKELPCLHGTKTFGAKGPPTYLDFVGTLTGCFSRRFVEQLDAAARQWRGAKGLSTPPLPG